MEVQDAYSVVVLPGFTCDDSLPKITEVDKVPSHGRRYDWHGLKTRHRSLCPPRREPSRTTLEAPNATEVRGYPDTASDVRANFNFASAASEKGPSPTRGRAHSEIGIIWIISAPKYVGRRLDSEQARRNRRLHMDKGPSILQKTYDCRRSHRWLPDVSRVANGRIVALNINCV